MILLWNIFKEFIAALWKATGEIPYLRYIIFGVILAMIMLVVFMSRCGSDSRLEKKIDSTDQQAVTQKAQTNSAAENVNAAKENSKQVEANEKEVHKNVNKAGDDYNSAVNTDSGKYGSNDAGEKFCKRFPGDSSCRTPGS